MIGIKRFPHYPKRVAAELLLDDYFVTCDEEKVPLIAIPNGAIFEASSTDPDTWRSHSVAFETYINNAHISGVGRVITATDPYVGVDLDDVLDPETGEVEGWAMQIIDELDSYSEISPSGTGVKIWIKNPGFIRSYKKARLEIYARSRYFTLTGQTFPGSRNTVEERATELGWIIERDFPQVENHDRGHRAHSRLKSSFDLDDLLDRAGVEKRLRDDTTSETKYEILCPWYREHTRSVETGTRVGRYEDGGLWFRCEHSHCAHRTWSDFKHWLKSIVYRGRPPRSKGKKP